MTIWLLPTVSPVKYRGKHGTRPRMLSATRVGGRHVELLNGTRLWSIDDRTPEFSAGGMNDDYASCLARAVPMTAAQYAVLQDAAQLERTAARRPVEERLEAGNRARDLRCSIQPDSFQRADMLVPVVPGSPAARDAELNATDVAEIAEQAEPATLAPGYAAPETETISPVRRHLQLMRAGMVAIAACEAEPIRLRQTRGPDGQSVLVKAGETATGIRRDNVEYHAGKAAREAGKPESACPYLAGERAARWALGWREATPANDGPHMIVGRSIDGTQTFALGGWQDSPQGALAMTRQDAETIAAELEEQESRTRSPESGVYQISAVPFVPALYRLDDWRAAQAFDSDMAAYFEREG